MSEVVPDFRDFRKFVDNNISKLRDSFLIKTLYLLAARNCEVITKVSASHTRVDKAYGKYLRLNFANYENIKVLLVTCPVAKRKLKADGTPYTKIIALPCEDAYESWTRDLLKHYQLAGRLSFNLTRDGVRKILRKNLGSLLPPRLKNPLRHFRVTHLITEYGFDPNDLTAYAGWTLKTGFGKAGVVLPSDQLGIYQHLRWRDYIKKLMKPLILEKFSHEMVA